MFGKNETAVPVWLKNAKVSPQVASGEKVILHSVFYTIQGEGPHAGEPAVFVRLAGCHLKCFFCDTDFEGGEEVSVARVIEAVLACCDPQVCDLIVLTGGEPLRQQVVPLCRALAQKGFLIQIETAGTLWPPGEGLEDLVQCRDVELVCSPKTRVVHPTVERLCHHFKYITRTKEKDPSIGDGLPIMSTQKEGEAMFLYRPKDPAATIWVQPCFEYFPGRGPDEQRNVANQMECVRLAKKHGYRISMQIHKILDIE